MDSRSIGRWGERWARLWLRLRGHRILQTNVYARCGELDIISRRGRTLFIVEVKTRLHRGRRAPVRALTSEKRRRILRTAARLSGPMAWGCHQVVFSFAEVTLSPFPSLRFIRDAFRVEEVADRLRD